jgi:glyoxylase-like metal-dependent hydrolase (beta-lactamase superfamily II)
MPPGIFSGKGGRILLKISRHNHVLRLDIARSIFGRGRYWTTTYLIDGLLVDSGCVYCAPELLQTMETNSLSTIVNTHSHEDHIGANGLLQSHQAELEILAHPLALPIIGDPRISQPLQWYRRFFWGYPESSNAAPIANHDHIETDHYTFQAIYTPGHSPDHICLYELNHEWLFSGDLFVGGKDRALRADCNIWQIISSLKLIADLPIRWLFPGSARVRENPRGELKAKIAYLEDMGGNVFDLHKKGWGIPSIVRELCGNPMWIEVITRGHFSRDHLIESFIRDFPERHGG